MSTDSIEELVSRIQAGDSECMMELYENVKRLLDSICNKYRGLDEMEDLEQESYIALYGAVKGYDEQRQVKFTTYLTYCVEGRLKRYLDRGGFSYHSAAMIRKYNAACSRYRALYGNDPELGWIAAYLGLGIEQAEQLRDDARRSQTVSLDAPISEENGDFTIGDMMSSQENLENSVIDALDNERLGEILWNEVDNLPGYGPEVIRSYYQDNMTISEIAQKMALPSHKIAYSRKKSLDDLGKSQALKYYRDDLSDAYNEGLKHVGVNYFKQTGESSTERAALRHLERAEIQQRTEAEDGDDLKEGAPLKNLQGTTQRG